MKPADSSQPSSEGFDAPGLKLTYDDFLLFPDDGQRHELIDGEHYVTPSPNIRHQDISGRLHLLIGNWLRRIGSAGSSTPRSTCASQCSTSSSPTCCMSRTNARPIFWRANT